MALLPPAANGASQARSLSLPQRAERRRHGAFPSPSGGGWTASAGRVREMLSGQYDVRETGADCCLLPHPSSALLETADATFPRWGKEFLFSLPQRDRTVRWAVCWHASFPSPSGVGQSGGRFEVGQGWTASAGRVREMLSVQYNVKNKELVATFSLIRKRSSFRS